MEPETTYHYAVSAINPDGTSQQSDTISATTQAAPQDDETISAQQSYTPTLAVSNLAPFSISKLLITGTEAYAIAFTTGSDPTYVLHGARLRVDADTGVVFTVAIYNDNSGSPGTIQRTLTHPATVDQTTNTIEEFTADETLTLTGDTKYWLAFERVSGSGDLRVRAPGAETLDAGGFPGWSIGGTQDRGTSSEDWETNQARMAIGVIAQRIPQPALEAPTLAVSNLAPFSISKLLITGTEAYAIAFTTGSDPTYVLHGARLRVDADTGVVFTVAIYNDNSGSPGTIQRTLTHPATVDQTTNTIEEFTADETLTLTGDTKYWLAFERVSGSGDLRVRAPGAETLDAGGFPGWSIGGTQDRGTSSEDWETNQARMAIGVIAQRIPQLAEVEITSTPLDGTTYKAGENVEIKFTFTIPVTYKGGVAAIRVGDQTDNSNYRSAGYVGGSGTKKLLYRYKVKSTDTDTTGIGVDGSALGGVATDKIVDANGNVVILATDGLDADLDHKVAGSTVGCRDVLCTDMTVHVQSITPMTVLGAFYYPDKSPEGLLSNRSFHLSQNYVIRQVVLRNNNKLELLLDRPPTQQLLTQGEFYIAGTLHSFTDATVDGNKITWPVTGLVWPEGQEIRINLRDNVLVSNTGQTTSQSNAAITRPDRLAQQFTTGNRANGYKIDVVNLGLEIGDGSGAVVRVAIYSDNSDAPGASKHVLTNPATIDGDADTFEKFTATDVILNSRTKYWLVVQRVSGTSNVSIRSTSSADEDTITDAGWSVNGSIWRTDTNEVWEQVTILGTLNMKMSIQGEESNITSPAFTKSAETLSVTENAQHDTSLGTITANDPDGDELEYTVTGTDADDFTNVLSFDRLTGEIKARRVSGFDHTKIDYETKASYSVIISVTDGEDITGATEPTATIDDTIAVTITVTDLEEVGTVILSRETPRVGTQVTASIIDSDGGVSAPTWQWSKSDTLVGTLTDITGATEASYTPVSADLNKYLRVSASYTDRRGPDKNAISLPAQVLVSIFTAPAFPDTDNPPDGADPITLTIDENSPGGTNVGTVMAIDEDGDTFAIGPDFGPDLVIFGNTFDYDTSTGIITLKAGATIDYETKASYSINIGVADGEDANGVIETSISTDDTVAVTINVNNLEEEGTVALSTSQPQIGVSVTATLTDPDGGITGQTWQWSRGDTASGPFTDVNEATSSSYMPVQADAGKHLMVSVTYSDAQGPGKSAAKTADNPVLDLDQPGSVSLSTSRPQLGVSVTATLTDPDGSITGESWKWARGDAATGPFNNISGATSSSYMPVEDDVGKYLMVSVTYSDTLGSGKSATKTAENPLVAILLNQTPMFTRTITVSANAAPNSVVGTIGAIDYEGDTLTHSVRGTDIDAFNEDFTLNTVNGQIRVRSEATMDSDTKPSYTVTIEVTDGKDPYGSPSLIVDASILLTINVANIEQAGTVTLSRLRPVLDLSLSATLTDPNGGITGQTWQWSHGDTARDPFTDISGATSASYTPVQADVGKYLKVRVTYSDALGSGRSAEAMTSNAVTDTPVVNAPPTFDPNSYTRTVAENTPADENVGSPVTGTDPNNDTLTYSLGGNSAGSFKIVADTGQIRTRYSLNFESTSQHELTVTAHDLDGLTGTATVTVSVTNVDEPGTVTISPGRPRLNNDVTATLNDPDGGVSSLSWQWSRADTETGPFSDISGATSAEYTTTESDNGKYLRVQASYTDTLGSGRSAEQVTSGPVITDPFEGVVQFHPWHDAGDLPVGGSATGQIQGGPAADDVRDVADYFELTGLTSGETYQITLTSNQAESYHFTGITYYGPASHLYQETMGDFQNAGFTPGRRHILFTPNNTTKQYFIGIKGGSSADHEYTVRLFKPTEDDYEASTAGAAADGSFGSGNIERLYDVDWHRTSNLSGSTKYLVTLTGAGEDPLYNPVIDGIYDPSGNLIADTSDTNSGPGNDSALVFTPESPGRYYIAVRGNVQPWVTGGADDPTGRGHTGSYTLTIGTVSDPDNSQGTTTMRLGTTDTPLVLDQEYSQEFALEHREDQEYIKVSLEEDKIYEIYVHGVSEGFPSISVHGQQDADAPTTACSTSWHRVFATPEDFSPSTATYKDYAIKLSAGHSGAGTGTVTIKLIDNDAGNYRSYSDHCP